MAKQLSRGIGKALIVLPLCAFAGPDEISLYPGKTYSPYAERDFPTQVYWGDSHVHTALSADAGLFGNTLGLDPAYKFARGEEVRAASGQMVKLGRPLDWLVVTEHSDLMGFASDLQVGTANIRATEKGEEWYQAFIQGGEARAAAALDLITNFAQQTLPEKLVDDYSPGSKVYARVWSDIVEAAERYNEPGHFTALIGYEWTSLVKGNNLHRNIIYRDGADKAVQVVPMTTQPPIGANDEISLYRWLEDYEKKTGGKVFALAHNGNLSNGYMFPTDKTATGGNVDKEYMQLRAKWEPLYEVTQIKGDGETHPYLSPDDEFADYETWANGNLDASQAKQPEMLQGEYAREALKQGLVIEQKYGVNPYKFGMLGSTDTHTSLATAEEENFFGKSSSYEPIPERSKYPLSETEAGVLNAADFTASGYAGVWATENTREAIYDALARKEVYATTGPRMTVRFFGGWQFVSKDLRTRHPEFHGYGKGVPMGADLPQKAANAPSFLVYALRDPESANLDRIQIVKGWVDSAGKSHEKVYNVAWSGDRKLDQNGKLPPVGNTVDLEAASWVNSIGAPELGVVWIDPDFDPQQPAFYYARVLEIPTPRWTLHDRVRLGAELPEGTELVGQERAYTSPIWYTP